MAGVRWKLLAFLIIACSGEDSTDQCAECHKYAECKDPTRTCMCKRGFIGNGVTLCVDENECLLPPEFLCGLQANCTNTFGGYYCTCLRGYVSTNMKTTFQPNDGTICVDLDECMEKPTVCGDGGHCFNTLGSYHCSCLPGYKRMQPGLLHPIENETFCIDIDECLENMTACKNGSHCSNSHGSFSCSEPLSHSPKLTSHNTANSKDVAECTQNKTACKNGSRCSNSSGSFSCSEHLSHSPKLTSHKSTNSTDIEECMQNKTACKNGRRCSNSSGSFSCSEPSSHSPKLTSHTTTNSADIEECLQNMTACKNGRRCSNSSGSFSCSEPLSHFPKLTSHNKTNSADIEECLQNMTACKTGRRCSNSSGSFSCSEPLSHFPKLTSHNKTNSTDGAVNGSEDITVLLTIIFSTLAVISFLACLYFFRSLKTKWKGCVAESI